MQRRKHRSTPLLEWAIGVIGAAIVAGSVGFMLYQALRPESPYPDLHVAIVETRSQPGGYIVAVEVVNRGGATAQSTRVTGRLQGPAGPETSEVTIDYVPAGSSRRAGLFFRTDPTRYPLELRADGYQKP